MNCYLLDGPDPVLVDCGPPTPEAEVALRAGLAAIGLGPSDLASIVLTHHHPDHSGGLRWLAAEAPAPVLGHPWNDFWLLGDPVDAESRVRFYLEYYQYCGATGAVLEGLRHRYAEHDRPLAVRPIDLPLREGDLVDLAGSDWRVLETPGHAGTSISLLRADGTVLVGDTLLDRISSNALTEPPYPGQSGRVSSLLVYRHTLQRLAALPLGVILPGHGAHFTEAAALISRRLQSQEERARRLLGHLGSGHDTVLSLTRQLFPALQDDQLFLGLSETLGHLDVLEEQGLALHVGEQPAHYRAQAIA